MADSDSSWRGTGLTNAFWDSDRWLPDIPDSHSDSDGLYIMSSIKSSLKKMSLHGDMINVHGDVEKNFTDDTLCELCENGALACFTSLTTASPQLVRLHVMLVDIVYHAWLSMVKRQSCCLAIFTRLSNDEEGTDMLCRVLGSLTARRVSVLLVVPGFDGIHSICPEKSAATRIPVWPIPGLFDGLVEKESLSFLEPPETGTRFTMPDNVETCVFWDLEDYPLPPGLDLVTFVENIKLHAETSSVSIYAYVVKEKDAELLKDLKEIIVVHEAPTNKVARLAKMMMDILLWSMDNNCPPRPDLVVISKVLEDDIFGFVAALGNIRTTKCNVLLALPTDQLPQPRKYYFPVVPWDLLTTTSSSSSSSLGKRKSRDDGGSVLTPTPLL